MVNLIETIRIGSLLLNSFLPTCTQKVLDAFGITDTQKAFEDLDNFYYLKAGQLIEPISILFPRLDIAAEMQKLSELA